MRNACLLLLSLLLGLPGGWAHAAGPGGVRVPILVYHRFGNVVADSMTVQTAVFSSHLEYLRTHRYTVIPLRELVAHAAGAGPAPRERSVVITIDDGHASVFTDMFPLIVRSHIPVTLFVYPSAISNAPYALTWAQLREMRDSGLVDVQSHSYWHPNFIAERRRLSASAYDELVREQMTRSKAVLEQRLGGHVDMLAWPFGIYDADLIRRAKQAGYIAAFTLERRPARDGDDLMALPRFLVTNAMQGRAFARLLEPPGPDGRREPRPRAGRDND